MLALEPADDGDRPRGGKVRMRGPFGLMRTARTRVDATLQHTRLSGTAEVGPHTCARVTWTLTPAPVSTAVRLEAVVERAGPLDATLLALGGRRWMKRRFGAILETLERRAGAGQSRSE